MNLGITNKKAIVTGSGRGIGKAIAIALAREGCDVAICSRTESDLAQVKKEIEELGKKVIAIQLDVCNYSEINKFVNKIQSQWGETDILINNAGSGETQPNTLPHELSDELWLESINLNLLAAIRFSNLLIPGMRIKKWGRVITIASRNGKEAGGKPWYTISKAAEISLMKTLSMNFEYVRDGITFNSIAPGVVLTEKGSWSRFKQKEPEKFQKRINETLPLGRPGLPDEVANVVAFLCSYQACFLNGACIPVDGGESKSY